MRKWTIKEAKAELPTVPVRCGRDIRWSPVYGRKDRRATVFTDKDVAVDFSWGAIVRCLNIGLPLSPG